MLLCLLVDCLYIIESNYDAILITKPLVYFFFRIQFLQVSSIRSSSRRNAEHATLYTANTNTAADSIFSDSLYGHAHETHVQSAEAPVQRYTRLHIDNQYARLCALANCFPRCVFAWETLGAPCLVRRHRKVSCYSRVCWITMCTPSFSGVNRKFIPYKESPNLTAMSGFRHIH